MARRQAQGAARDTAAIEPQVIILKRGRMAKTYVERSDSINRGNVPVAERLVEGGRTLKHALRTNRARGALR